MSKKRSKHGKLPRMNKKDRQAREERNAKRGRTTAVIEEKKEERKRIRGWFSLPKIVDREREVEMQELREQLGLDTEHGRVPKHPNDVPARKDR